MDPNDVPAELKPLSMYLKCASEYTSKDPVISYYCMLYSFQKGYETNQKSPGCRNFLGALMTKLENFKASNKHLEGIASEPVGLAHLEEFALSLFSTAYNRDLNSNFEPVTVKMFYNAGLLLDVACGLGTANDELEKAKKYAKWKAVYITRCLKAGEKPVAGPVPNTDASDLSGIAGISGNAQPSSSSSRPAQPVSPKPFVPSPSNNLNEDDDANAESDDDLSVEQFLNAEKQAKCALSAINHQDRNTAVNYLRAALQALGVQDKN